MAILFAGLDHVAGLRQAGGTPEPDPVAFAALAELAGAGGISLSLGRERGVSERDLRLLHETVQTVLNVNCPPREEWIKLALATRPDLVTLTPTEYEGLGSERGLDVEDRRSELAPVIDALKARGIAVGVLLEAVPAQVKAAQRAGVHVVVLHTGRLAVVAGGKEQSSELERIVNAAKIAHKLGLAVHAAGGLRYQSVGFLAEIPEIGAVHVGHSLVARSSLVGVPEAVRELLRRIEGPAEWAAAAILRSGAGR
jgi:pyridoxine 5-phosphate synthase